MLAIEKLLARFYSFTHTPNQQSKARLLALIKQNSVISWQHVNLYGEYDFTVANDENYSFDFEIDKICKLKIA